MSHANTSPDPIKSLDIDYRDLRGVIVHVTGWKFQQYFTRCDE
ncbi:hypothetical protein ACQLT9_001166 [Salmonella enterica subsp. diarizonae]